MKLPTQILQAISRSQDGGLAIVMGAGCSMENPPGLKSAEYYASKNFDRLVSIGKIADNPDLNKADLAEVSSYCVDNCGTRDVLTELLPVHKFRMAEAGSGTLIAAALLREDVIRVIITLNLDNSTTNALTRVSAADDVTIINRQSEYSFLSIRSLVYLHGNINGVPDEWILTNEDIDRVADSAWAELMVKTLALSQVTLFAGMGSKAMAFANSAEWIRTHLKEHEIFLASLDEGPISSLP